MSSTCYHYHFYMWNLWLNILWLKQNRHIFFTTCALLKRLIFAPYHSKSQKLDFTFLHRLFSINGGILLHRKTNNYDKVFSWLSLPQYIKTKARYYFIFNNFIYFSFLTATWARYFRIIMILSLISFTSAINKLLKLLCCWSSYLWKITPNVRLITEDYSCC